MGAPRLSSLRPVTAPPQTPAAGPSAIAEPLAALQGFVMKSGATLKTAVDTGRRLLFSPWRRTISTAADATKGLAGPLFTGAAAVYTPVAAASENAGSPSLWPNLFMAAGALLIGLRIMTWVRDVSKSPPREEDLSPNDKAQLQTLITTAKRLELANKRLTKVKQLAPFYAALRAMDYEQNFHNVLLYYRDHAAEMTFLDALTLIYHCHVHSLGHFILFDRVLSGDFTAEDLAQTTKAHLAWQSDTASASLKKSRSVLIGALAQILADRTLGQNRYKGRDVPQELLTELANLNFTKAEIPEDLVREIFLYALHNLDTYSLSSLRDIYFALVGNSENHENNDYTFGFSLVLFRLVARRAPFTPQQRADWIALWPPCYREELQILMGEIPDRPAPAATPPQPVLQLVEAAAEAGTPQTGVDSANESAEPAPTAAPADASAKAPPPTIGGPDDVETPAQTENPDAPRQVISFADARQRAAERRAAAPKPL